MSKIAVVGPRDTVLAFKALGLDVRPVDAADEASQASQAAQAVYRLAEEGAAVIFITEELAAQIDETISRYKSEALPAIIPIPGASGATGEGMKRVRANVEKAIGADILFKEEG